MKNMFKIQAYTPDCGIGHLPHHLHGSVTGTGLASATAGRQTMGSDRK